MRFSCLCHVVRSDLNQDFLAAAVSSNQSGSAEPVWIESRGDIRRGFSGVQPCYEILTSRLTEFTAFIDRIDRQRLSLSIEVIGDLWIGSIGIGEDPKEQGFARLFVCLLVT